MGMEKITARDMRFNPPDFDQADIAARVFDEYGLQGELAPLIGERDQNFLLKAEDGRKFVVKIAGPDEEPDVADFQAQGLLYLEKKSPHIPVPRIIRTRDGRCLSNIADAEGVEHAVRVVTYLEGIPYSDGVFPDAANLQAIGAFLGEVVNALAGFEHRASRHFMPWSPSNRIAVSEEMWADVADDARALAAPLLNRLRNEVLPALNAGPSQVIHNDAHSWNLLRPDAVSQQVVGLIDFGDMTYAPVINDLAVMASSFQRRGRENIDPVKNLLIGFHRTHPLSDTEVSLLWDAITLRVLLAIQLSEVKLNADGDPDPDVIDERKESCSMLEFICSLDHGCVVNEMRTACGYR